MSNPLGRHIYRWDLPEVKDSVRRAPGHTLKLMGTSALSRDPLEHWRWQRPQGQILYRHYWQYQTLDNPVARAREIIAALADYRDLIVWVEAPYNECYQRAGQLARYAAFTVEATRVLHDAGLLVAVGNFSTGNPPLEILPEFFPALEVADALSLHEYAPWGLRRYREVLAALPPELDPPVWITECGYDDGRGDGWQKYLTAREYADLLAAYVHDLAADRRVLGGHIFTDTGWGFETFDMTGVPEVEAVLNTVSLANSGNIPTTDDTGGGNDMAYNVGEGIQRRMDELKDEPASNEYYPQPQYAEAMGTSGRIYRYVRDTNTVHVYNPTRPRRPKD